MKRARKRFFISYRVLRKDSNEPIRRGNATFISLKRNTVTSALIHEFEQRMQEYYKFTDIYVEILEIK